MDLSPEQKAEAQRLFEAFPQTFLDEARRHAELLACKPDAQLLGQTEFEVRSGPSASTATTTTAAPVAGAPARWRRSSAWGRRT